MSVSEQGVPFFVFAGQEAIYKWGGWFSFLFRVGGSGRKRMMGKVIWKLKFCQRNPKSCGFIPKNKKAKEHRLSPRDKSHRWFSPYLFFAMFYAERAFSSEALASSVLSTGSSAVFSLLLSAFSGSVLLSFVSLGAGAFFTTTNPSSSNSGVAE